MTDERAGLTEQRLDLTAIAAPDRELSLNVVYRELLEDGSLGEVVSVEGTTFAVRGHLPVPTMTAFLRLETAINEALAADEHDADVRLERTLQDAHDRIVTLIAEKTPLAFRPTTRSRDLGDGEAEELRVKPVLELDVSEILILLSWVAGDTSVADAIAKALTGGASPAKALADLEGDAEPSDRAGQGRGPLRSSAR